MSKPLAVVVYSPSEGGFYYGGVLAGITREIATVGGRVILVQTLDAGLNNDQLPAVPPYEATTAWERAAGFIVLAAAAPPAYLQRLIDTGKPLVLAGHCADGIIAPAAMPDNIGGVRAAVEHLIAHGHTRIGFVGNLEHCDTIERHQSYTDTLVRHGLRVDDRTEFIVPDQTEIAGRGVAPDIAAACDRMTAIIAATDRNALGLMEVLPRFGVQPGRDLAIIGFDDVETGRCSTPTLSTVRQGVVQLGELAGRLMLAKLRGDDVPSTRYTTATAFIPRGSCGCDDGVSDAVGEARGVAEGPGVGSPRDALRRRVRVLLETAHERGPGDASTLIAAVEDIADLLDAAAPARALPERSKLRDAALRISRAHLPLEAAGTLASAVTEYGSGLVRGTPAGDTETQLLLQESVIRLTGSMLEAQAQDNAIRAMNTEMSVRDQYAIGVSLVREGRRDAHTLGWLAASQATAGCLALWDQIAAGSGQLSIAGAYHCTDVLASLVGSASTIESFPPENLIELADGTAGELVYVVPVTARGNDWGLLAIVGGIDANLLTGRETLNHWAALLCVAFDQDALLASTRSSEERYALAAHAANDGLWDWDVATDAVYYSPRWSANLGYDEAQIAPSPDAWFDRVHPDDIAILRAGIGDGLAGDPSPIEIEHRVRTASGEYRWMLCRAAAVIEPGGRATRMVGSLTDIDARKSLEAQLRYGALHDTLTGLPNRALLLDRLSWAIERLRTRSDAIFTVLFLDLDGFKVVNDSLGHHVGDRLLVEVGNRLRACMRSVDTAARVGGDEFVLLLLDLEPSDIPDVVGKVQASLAEPFDLDGHQVVVTVSIGIATSRPDYANADDVLRDADIAMYRAKARERGSYEIFDTAMHARAVQRLQTEVELRRALDLGEFEVHYQPIVDLGTCRARAFEALIRWRHPERGLISPDDFLPVAEETGLIVRLGHWIISETCRQIAHWRETYDGELSVSVNVSNREFWHGGLLEHVLASVAAHGLTSSSLKLEITEGVIMHNPEHARVLMEELHAEGIRLHIDDFGTGYSSLQSLHRFPIQALKIDRSFVAGMGGDSKTMELVHTIVAMGRNLGVDVIAEGVETPQQQELLRRVGCPYAQGYWFARPMPGESAGALLGRALPVAAVATTPVSRPIAR